MRRLPLLLLCLLLQSLSPPLASADDPFPPGFWDPVVQYLDGSDWVLENANRSVRLLNATVPGNVWTSLLADPLHGYLERDLQWINTEPYWHYSKVFEVDQALWFDFVSFYYEVVLDGVDCLSRVLINGVDVGLVNGYTTSNAFRRYVYPAPLFDNSQFNRIDVYLYPSQPYIDAAASSYPYPIPAIDPDGVESNRSFIRKATSDFGWDFAPHFTGVGIDRSIYLRAFNQAYIQDVTTRQTRGVDMTQAERERWGMAAADVLLNTTVFLRTAPHNTSGVLSVSIAGLSITLPVAFPAAPTASGDFLYSASLLLPIPSPTLWWPHTLGSPHLYPLTATFNGSSTLTEGVHTVTRTVGFRTIDVQRQPTPNSPGLSFQFLVNDVPLFIKGANLTPFDPFHARVSGANVSRVLQSAVDAGMNMVRVWGGAGYQSEAVYDWADEHGLLVWQEVAFACQMVPVLPSFLDSIREEVSQQVRRWGSRASLAIVGGNNENEEALGWWPVTQANRDRYLVDYARLYIDTVRDAVVREIGLDVEYVTSSPSNGPLSLHPYVQRWGNPGDYTYGDTHFYPDPDKDDFAEASTWPRARFISEFGFPSFASRLTMETAAPSPSDVAVNSTFLNWRQRYGLVQEDGSTWVTEVNVLEMAKHFRLPDVSRMSYDDFAYLSQANQALAYSTAIQAFRRQMSESPSFTSGCLFWQLNDIWQAPSYAAIEYGGRWKMVMHAAKRDYTEKLVSGYVYPIVNGSRAQFGVYVVNDGRMPINGLLSVDVRRWSDSTRLLQHNMTYAAQELGATRLWVITVGALLNGTCQPRDCYVTLTATWSDGVGDGVMRSVVYLTHLVEVDLPKPVFVISVALEGPAPHPSTHPSHSPHHARHSLTVNGGGLLLGGELAAEAGCDDAYPLAALAAKVRGGKMVTEVVVSVFAAQTSPFTWLETAVSGRWSDNGLLLVGKEGVNLTFTADEPVDPAVFLVTLTVRSVFCTYNRP